MSAGQRSIGQRLRKAKSAEVKAEVVREWSLAWQAEQEVVVAQLDRARREGDWQAVASAAGQLHEISSKRFAALPGVLHHLLGYEQDGA